MTGRAPNLAEAACWAVVALAAQVAGALAAPEVLDAYYRADEPFPQYLPFWREAWELDARVDDAAARQARAAAAGSLHVFVRNVDGQPLQFRDVELEGVSLTRAIAFAESTRKGGLHPASLLFAALAEADRDRLLKAGEPVWWRIDPSTIPPGGTAEAIVRLRHRPEAETLRVGLVGEGLAAEATVRVGESPPRCLSVGFSRALDRVYLYLSQDAGQPPPGRIRWDGVDVGGAATVGYDPGASAAVVELRLRTPLERGSFHCFQASYENGVVATAGVRAWGDELGYGIWGSRPGRSGDEALARSYVQDIYDHNINVQMEMVGSAAVREYLKSEGGRAFYESLGIRRMVREPRKGLTRKAHSYFLVDEPDCGDYRVEELPPTRRVGSLAQALVGVGAHFRDVDPVTPHLLNVDLTYKPQNWYIYGQLPDILAVDPYYQERLRSAYWDHPERLPLYTKATYVYAVGTVCRSACAPQPLHLILNSVCHTQKDRRFRYATPAEKRIEVYYAIAAGATGISYWWYTPVAPYVGCGADDPGARDLWREIGLLGAEVRTAGPVLVRSCPIELPVTASRRLWVRTLAAGLDTLVVLVVNDDYANDRVGTVWQPVEKAALTLRLPVWLAPRDAFEITAAGLGDATWSVGDGELRLELGTLELTRMIVISRDDGLRRRLQALYDQQFAARCAELLAGG